MGHCYCQPTVSPFYLFFKRFLWKDVILVNELRSKTETFYLFFKRFLWKKRLTKEDYSNLFNALLFLSLFQEISLKVSIPFKWALTPDKAYNFLSLFQEISLKGYNLHSFIIGSTSAQVFLSLFQEISLKDGKLHSFDEHMNLLLLSISFSRDFFERWPNNGHRGVPVAMRSFYLFFKRFLWKQIERRSRRSWITSGRSFLSLFQEISLKGGPSFSTVNEQIPVFFLSLFQEISLKEEAVSQQERGHTRGHPFYLFFKRFLWKM